MQIRSITQTHIKEVKLTKEKKRFMWKKCAVIEQLKYKKGNSYEKRLEELARVCTYLWMTAYGESL